MLDVIAEPFAENRRGCTTTQTKEVEFRRTGMLLTCRSAAAETIVMPTSIDNLNFKTILGARLESG
jgi:hypothetical protein